MNERCEALNAWVASVIHQQISCITPLAGDAGCRRYFRVAAGAQTWIAVDAPPQTEKISEFIRLAAIFTQAGICVPAVMQQDTALGFLLLSDFGDCVLSSVLSLSNADHYYKAAMDTLLLIHQSTAAAQVNVDQLAGSFLKNECEQFVQWYVERHCQVTVDADLRVMFNKMFDIVMQNAAAQVQVCCHRDYHSRNIMLLPNHQLGIIDFQDAMMGPVTYDLVSLLRDCYIVWPVARVEQWVQYYHALASKAGILQDVSFEVFKRQFDLMGIQRHLKAIATFARKAHRDGDERYLGYIPTALHYLKNVSSLYPSLADFHCFVSEGEVEVL